MNDQQLFAKYLPHFAYAAPLVPHSGEEDIKSNACRAAQEILERADFSEVLADLRRLEDLQAAHEATGARVQSSENMAYIKEIRAKVVATATQAGWKRHPGQRSQDFSFRTGTHVHRVGVPYFVADGPSRPWTECVYPWD